MHCAGLRAQDERIFAIDHTADIADAWETHPMALGVGARLPGGGLDDASGVAAVSDAPQQQQQQPVLAASAWNDELSLTWGPEEIEGELGKGEGGGGQARTATGATGRVTGKTLNGRAPRGSHVTRMANGASAPVPDADGITREPLSADGQGPGGDLHRPQSRAVPSPTSRERAAGTKLTESNLRGHRTNSNGDGAEIPAAVAMEAQAKPGPQDPLPRILSRPWLAKARGTCLARSTDASVPVDAARLTARGSGHLAGIPAPAPGDGACPGGRTSSRLRTRAGDMASWRPDVGRGTATARAGRAEVDVSGGSAGEGVVGCGSHGAGGGDAPRASPAGGGRGHLGQYLEAAARFPSAADAGSVVVHGSSRTGGQAQKLAEPVELAGSPGGSSDGAAREKMAADDGGGATRAGDVGMITPRNSLANGTMPAEKDEGAAGKGGGEARTHARGTVEITGSSKVGGLPGTVMGFPLREDTRGSEGLEICQEVEQQKGESLAGTRLEITVAESEGRDEHVKEALEMLPSMETESSDQQAFSAGGGSENGGDGGNAVVPLSRDSVGQRREAAAGASGEVGGTVNRETPPRRPEPLQDTTVGGSYEHRASSTRIPSVGRVTEMRVTAFTPQGAVDAWPSPHGELSPGISVAEAAALMGSRSGRQFASGSSLGASAAPPVVDPERAAGSSVQASSPHHELLDPAHHSNSWPVIESSLDDIGTEATGRRASSGPIELGAGAAAVTMIGSRVIAMSSAAGVDDFLSPSLSVDAPGVAGLRRAASEGSLYAHSSRDLCAEGEMLAAGGSYDAAAGDDILLEEDLSDDDPQAASPDRRWEGATAVASSPGASADSKAHVEDGEAVVVVTVPCDAVVEELDRPGKGGASRKPGVSACVGSASGVGEAGSCQEAGRVAGNGDIDRNRHGVGAGRCCTVS